MIRIHCCLGSHLAADPLLRLYLITILNHCALISRNQICRIDHILTRKIPGPFIGMSRILLQPDCHCKHIIPLFGQALLFNQCNPSGCSRCWNVSPGNGNRSTRNLPFLGFGICSAYKFPALRNLIPDGKRGKGVPIRIPCPFNIVMRSDLPLNGMFFGRISKSGTNLLCNHRTLRNSLNPCCLFVQLQRTDFSLHLVDENISVMNG